MSGDDDAKLVAFIDGELDDAERGVIEARLAAEGDLRERLARLQEGGLPFAAAFRPLLDEAPIERLKASLAAIDVKGREEPRMPRRAGFRLSRASAAAAIVALFCVGAIFGGIGASWLDQPQQEDWRQAVAEYMSLYTPDTFSGGVIPQGSELSALGAKVGLTLTPERIALANLQFRGAQILNYEGAPLGQLAYFDPVAGVVLFCVIRDFEPDVAMKAEKREGFAMTSWARAGHGYMLIGRLPANQMAELADSLARRF